MMVLRGLLSAAEANSLDKLLKKKLMALSQDVNRISIVASFNRLYLDKNGPIP